MVYFQFISTDQATMRSNKLIYCFFRYIFFVLGILILGVTLRVAISSELSSGDWGQLIPLLFMALSGIGAIAIFLIINHRIAMVEISDRLLVISKNGERRAASWTDIGAISQIQLVQPPLYRLRMRSSEETILFNTDFRYFQIFGFTRDLSQMGRLIEEKKQEFKL